MQFGSHWRALPLMAGARQCESMRTTVIGLCFFVAYAGSAQEPAKLIPIWPAGTPGETTELAEHDTTTEKSPLVAGRRVIRLTGVSSPTITIYRPPKEKNTGAAVLVFPGGGYSILALDLEGVEVCEWLNSIGVTGVLLKYRVPAEAGS